MQNAALAIRQATAILKAVLIKQNGCGSSVHDFRLDAGSPVSTFDCSTFWALFWEMPPAKFPTVYSQLNLVGSVGTFHLSAALSDAVAVLRAHDFFALSPVDFNLTDTAASIIEVKRCAVVTKLRMYNSPLAAYKEPATPKLFAELRRVITEAIKTKVSGSPTAFGLNLFDP